MVDYTISKGDGRAGIRRGFGGVAIIRGLAFPGECCHAYSFSFFAFCCDYGGR